MNTYFNNENKNNIGSLIQVGSGSCNEINDYIAQGFEEIILLEPNPKVFKQLENKIAKIKQPNASKITALNIALSVKTGEQNFYVTQPNRYSGFNNPDKLKQLFQNLKIEQQITVNTLSFADLIKQTALDENKKNALLLQINGAEFDVLSQAEANDLMLFSTVIIQHCKKNYFQQDQNNNDLISLMKSKGYQLTIEDQGDVVFSNLVFYKDETALKVNVLNKRNIELESQLKASNETKSIEVNKAAEQIKAQAARIAELDTQLKASNETKSIEVNKAAEQIKAQAARIAELDTQLKASNETKSIEVNKAAEQIKAQAARIAELDTQLKVSNETKSIEVNKAAEQIKAQAARIAELDSQLKASNEAKSIEVNKSAEQIKAQAARIAELETQLKASNEAKASELTEARAKANSAAEQNKTQAARIAELETQLKASNEAKASELTEARAKANAVAEQNKTKTARIAELETQLKASNEAKASELTEARAKVNAAAEQNKTQAARIIELENQLKASQSDESKVIKFREELETKNEQHSSLQQDNENLINKVAVLSQTQNVQTKALQDVEQLKEELQAEVNSLRESAQQYTEQVITLEQEKQLLTEATTEHETLLANVTKEKDQQTHWHQENKKWAESLKVEVDKLKAELAEKTRSANLGQKMLAKAQIDLDDLRSKYSVKVTSETQLVELVNELRKKLVMASKYYNQLQQEHPELMLATSNNESF